MRHQRWLEILKDYDFGLSYHLGKANVVVDTLSRKSLLRDRACVPDVPKLKKSILEEAHRSGLSIHTGATKMYQELKKSFWWPRMKKEVARFEYIRLTCQKSKIEHQKSLDLMQLLSIPEWKWDNISMDLVTSLLRMTKGCDSIWVIVNRLTKSAHFIPFRISYPL